VLLSMMRHVPCEISRIFVIYRCVIVVRLRSLCVRFHFFYRNRFQCAVSTLRLPPEASAIFFYSYVLYVYNRLILVIVLAIKRFLHGLIPFGLTFSIVTLLYLFNIFFVLMKNSNF
jgi:hypothetical protein